MLHLPPLLVVCLSEFNVHSEASFVSVMAGCLGSTSPQINASWTSIGPAMSFEVLSFKSDLTIDLLELVTISEGSVDLILTNVNIRVLVRVQLLLDGWTDLLTSLVTQVAWHTTDFAESVLVPSTRSKHADNWS